jgi:hypothetical protein
MGLRKIAVLTTTAALAVVPSALATGLPKTPTEVGPPGRGDFQVKPRSIVYTGDGSGFLAGARKAHNRAGKLSWTSWTVTGALGSGFNWVDNCQPDCAGGAFHLFAVKLKLSGPKHVHGHFIFTRMKVTYTSKTPHGVKHRSEIWKVVYSSGTYSWSFPPF